MKITLDVLVLQEDILNALLESKEKKTIVGISSKSLGPGTYMTSVVELLITENNETIVVIRGYDMTGYFLDRSQLKLEEIESVIPFTALFQNPFLRKRHATDEIET